ncbi:MAG: hypothetical protein ACI89E_001595 [Planctomycetota bacterium]|jgi:hypothetical protein
MFVGAAVWWYRGTDGRQTLALEHADDFAIFVHVYVHVSGV